MERRSGGGLIAALSASAGIEPRDTLADTLEAYAAKLDGDVYVILDGVEEYFLYHEGESGPGTFFSELPEAVKRPGLRASFLLAIREDALAKLDRFKASIPNLFGNYLRLAHLDREAAKSAILGPVDRYNELVEASERMTVDPDLADAVLDEVAAGRVDLGQAGRGVVAGRASTTASRRRTSSSSCAGCGRRRRTQARACSARRRSRRWAERKRSFAPIWRVRSSR